MTAGVPSGARGAEICDQRIPVALPQLLHDETPDVLRRYAVRAEELGFAGLWWLDSVPGSATARVPLLDGRHLLTAAAAVTDPIGLGIAVILLPARNPARIGDGWLAAGSSAPAAFPEQLRVLVDALREVGRAPTPSRSAARVHRVKDTEQRARQRLTPILDGMTASPG